MQRVAFLFPGVGSQYPGMARWLFDSFASVRRIFEQASDALGRDMAKLCFAPDPPEELDGQENAQLALFTVSMATCGVFQEETGIRPDAALGHSLGEYSALCCAGVFSFENGLQIIRERGRLIRQVAATLNGTMAWIINLEVDRVVDVCDGMRKNGSSVFLSAHDSTHQATISGRAEDVLAAGRTLERMGALVYPLRLTGPFHSPLMADASTALRAVLESYAFQAPLHTVIANWNALPYAGGEAVLENLSQQLVRPVRWLAGIEYAIGEGATVAIEMGPKNVLKFLVDSLGSRIRTYTLDNLSQLRDVRRDILIHREDFPLIVRKCLKEAVTTKNRRADASSYESQVVRPFRAIQRRHQELVGEAAECREDDVLEALRMLSSILNSKQVPPQERESCLKRVLDGKLPVFSSGTKFMELLESMEQGS